MSQENDEIGVSVEVPASVLSALVNMARAHVEDVDSGIEEGIYDAADNTDLNEKRAALAAAEVLCPQAVMPGHGGIESLTGYLNFEGVEMRADFQVPVGAPISVRDAAFLAALAQQAEIDYLAIGTMGATES